RNFENAVQQVVPGDPASSRLLIHPLAPEAGGDPFHSGGRQFASQTDPDWLVLADWVRGLRSVAAPDPSSGETVRIYVTNSAGGHPGWSRRRGCDRHNFAKAYKKRSR